MQCKLFEVRDRATFIPVCCTLMRPKMAGGLSPADSGERYLLRRAGFGYDSRFVLMTRVTGGQAHFAVNEWVGNATMGRAHQYIAENWDTLSSGQVIDVEFIRGETTEPKQSERFSDGGAF